MFATAVAGWERVHARTGWANDNRRLAHEGAPTGASRSEVRAVTEETVMQLMSQVFVVAAKLAGPTLAAALVVGVIVSLLQAVTQVQEMTLAFVPKIIAVFAVLLLLGPWMLQVACEFTADLLTRLPELCR